MYATEPRYNEPRKNEILVITQSRSPNQNKYTAITNKCQHVTKYKCETDQQQSKFFNSAAIKQLHSQQLFMNTDTDIIDTSTGSLNSLCLLLVLLTSLHLKASSGKKCYMAGMSLQCSTVQ